jgi:hypothetical protein
MTSHVVPTYAMGVQRCEVVSHDNHLLGWYFGPVVPAKARGIGPQEPVPYVNLHRMTTPGWTSKGSSAAADMWRVTVESYRYQASETRWWYVPVMRLTQDAPAWVWDCLGMARAPWNNNVPDQKRVIELAVVKPIKWEVTDKGESHSFGRYIVTEVGNPDNILTFPHDTREIADEFCREANGEA